jgi:hypothetical protein
MAKNQKTNGKCYTERHIKSLIKECGLDGRFLKVGGEWDWYITRNGAPVYQGTGQSLVDWLFGYRRAVEDLKGNR